MKKNKTTIQNEEMTPKEVEVFFSMAKEVIPHAKRESLEVLLSKLPSVTQTESSRYESRTDTKSVRSPFTKLLFNESFGKRVRSPWMISSVGIATMFIVFVTSGVATTNKDITRLADKQYSIKNDIVFTTSNSLSENDITFISNELISYSSYVPEEDQVSIDIIEGGNKEITELSKISYEI